MSFENNWPPGEIHKVRKGGVINDAIEAQISSARASYADWLKRAKKTPSLDLWEAYLAGYCFRASGDPGQLCDQPKDTKMFCPGCRTACEIDEMKHPTPASPAICPDCFALEPSTDE